jgi:RNA polymerase sigma factor (TIGR02999 family)
VDDPGDITVLLHRWGGGDSSALEPLVELAYPQLKHIADALLSGRLSSGVLQPTSLVNEVYLKLIQQRRLQFEDRQHFFSLAARLMRRVLVDHIRHEGRWERDCGPVVPLHEELAWVNIASPEILDLDRILDELEAIDERKCRTVELRFFLGFTADETADLMGVSRATIDRDLRFVRGWIFDKFQRSSS